MAVTFPALVYKGGGPYLAPGGYYDYKQVADQTAYDAALAAGWKASLSEVVTNPYGMLPDPTKTAPGAIMSQDGVEYICDGVNWDALSIKDYTAATLPDPASLPVGTGISVNSRSGAVNDALVSDGERFNSVSTGAKSIGRYVKNATFSNTTELRKMFGIARSGMSITGKRLVKVGDSTTVGCGGGGSTYSGAARKSAITKHLEKFLTASGTPAQDVSTYSGGNLGSTDYPAYDPRWVLTGFTINNAYTGNFNTCFYCSTVGATAVFTPGMAFDKITILFAKAAGTAGFTTQIDGGASLGTTSTTSATDGLGNVVYSVMSGSATSTITITSTGTLFLLGVIVEQVSSPAIRIINFGANNNTITNAINSGKAYYGAFVPPTLAGTVAIIDLVINDEKSGTTTVDAYKTQLATLIDIYKTAGYEVYICSSHPIDPAYNAYSSIENQNAFQDAAYAVAVSKGCAFIDTYKYLESYAKYNSISFYYDQLHGTGKLYATKGEFLARALNFICDEL